MNWSGVPAASCAGVLVGAVVLFSGGNWFAFDAAGQRTSNPLPATEALEENERAEPRSRSLIVEEGTRIFPAADRDTRAPGAQIRAELEALAIAADAPGSDAVALLVEAALGHADVAVREEAVHGLGERRGVLVVPTLQQAIQDPQSRVRAASVRALTDVATEEAVWALGGVLGASDASLRLDATDALGQIGSRDAMHLLQQLTGDADPRVRESAEGWLEELGSAQER